MKKYNIFKQLETENNDFDTDGFYITGQPKSEVQFKGSKKGLKGGYYFSQKDTLEAVDMASASKFKKGILDSEKQRKTFINIVNFYRDVTEMKINIDVTNYIFEPTSSDYEWPVFLMSRKFNAWAEENSYDDQIDEYGHDLATYGTTVAKRCMYNTERVPLRTLRNTQNAKTLYDGCINGGFATIEDEKQYHQMESYPGWNIDGLSKGKTFQIFERYGLVPKKLLENWKTNGGVLNDYNEDTDDLVLVQAVLAPDEREKGKEHTGRLLWMEELTEESFPLEECHAEKIDGRWLGRGEIEKQLENQIARNLTANLRRRGLLWATKKIYQSSDDEVQSQLLMEVLDGQVLHVKPNGIISQVNTGNQHTGDFSSDEQTWKENSQQNSFAFNIATGDDLPSGTSFSLGVVMERAVTSHFSKTRKKYSNFLKRCYFDQLIPIFIEENSEEHTQQFAASDSDIENLREDMIIYHMNERKFDAIIKRKNIDEAQIRMEVEDEISRSQYLFVDIEEGFYSKIHYFMRLNIVDDIASDVQTLTTIYEKLDAKGDPRAEQVLKKIMAKQGKSLVSITGRAKLVQPLQPGQQNGIKIPSQGIPSPLSPESVTT